jgi:hypothetical protein
MAGGEEAVIRDGARVRFVAPKSARTRARYERTKQSRVPHADSTTVRSGAWRSRQPVTPCPIACRCDRCLRGWTRSGGRPATSVTSSSKSTSRLSTRRAEPPPSRCPSTSVPTRLLASMEAPRLTRASCAHEQVNFRSDEICSDGIRDCWRATVVVRSRQPARAQGCSSQHECHGSHLHPEFSKGDVLALPRILIGV